MNIFHHSSAFIAKHKRHHHLALATLALIIASAGVYTYRHEFAQAATFTFNQTSWAGGLTSNTETHTAYTSNPNWTEYSATSSTSVLASASGVSLSATPMSATDDGQCSQATGGTVTYSGGYCIHTFNTSGTFQITGSANINYLVIGGGGASGKVGANGGSSGAGGAGGYVEVSNYSYAVTTGSYGVSVGSAGATTTAVGGSGGNSVFNTGGTNGGAVVTAYGGGGGGVGDGSTNTNGTGANGGSGGGAGAATTIRSGGSATPSGQGYAGGSIIDTASRYGSAGGGGAGGLGGNEGASDAPGAGGAGVTSSITGTAVCRAGGGGGSAFSAGGTATCGGGAGGQNAIGTAGTTNTGGGGGGSTVNVTGRNGANGGSGLVIIRYQPTAQGFESGTLSSTVQTGTGSAASVGLALLTPAGSSGTGADGAIDLTSACTGTGIAGTWPACTIATLAPTGGSSSNGSYNYTSFNLPAGVTLSATGNLGPLVIKATGNVTIAGTLNAYGVTSTAVAGGSGGGTTVGGISTPGSQGDGAGCGAGGVNRRNGGGGGSYGGAGYKPSGASNGGCSYNSADTESFGGGGAGGVIGGASGGNIKIYSSSTISVSGTISTNGVLGGNGCTLSYGGGGGGSGGRVFLFGDTVTNTGVINAIGGNAGSSDYGGASYGGGGSGGRVYVYGNSVTLGTVSVLGGFTPISTCFGGGSSTRAGTGATTTAAAPYASSGTFTSATINLGSGVAVSPAPTLSWGQTLNGGTITMQVRTAPDNGGGSPGTWSSYADVTNGGTFTGNKFVQYKATLGSASPYDATPTLNDVTIGYSQYALSGNLTSSKYDTGVTTNTFSKVIWNATTPAGTGVQFQVRTASTSADLDNAAWCGPANCSGTDYFTTSNQSISNTALTDSVNDQWLQYKVFLTSGGDITPVLTSATLQYVQNGAPVVSNVVASQITTSTDPNYGKVVFSFDASDSDTASGTVPYIVTPTKYEYYDGTWHDICTTATAPCATLPNSFSPISIPSNLATTNTTVVWTPPAGIPLTTGAKIRVTVTDGEGANFLGVGTSGTFPLDTAAPTVTIATFDSTQDVVSFTVTDASAPTYKICNDINFTGCATWTAVTSASATSTSWTPIGAPGAETIYILARDSYGNTSATSTITAPATPGSFLVADISNPGAGTYGESLSWIAPQGATSYNIYYATTSASTVAPTTYTSLAMGATSNVYNHTITTATSSAYWYKVSAIGNSNTSNFATENTGDVPDSFGTALSDTTPPTVTSVATSSVLSTSAVVTVTTNELASIQIFYSPAGYASGCLYTAHTQPSAVYSTSTVVTLIGLNPSTAYNFCVKATDVAGNPSLGTSSIENSSFTTVSGPGMVGASTYTVTSNTATINWTTSTTSDSYVTYGTPAFGTNNKRIGVSTYITTTDGSGNYVHAITLTGLTAGTDYYYQVESSNTNGTTIDTNTGAYYHFKTTIDITPPVITGTSTPVLAPNAAVIVWQTDEPATSKIDYGLTTAYGKGVAEDAMLTIWHVMTLSSSSDNAYVPGEKNALTANTDYYYRITSKDAANNPATALGTFKTPTDGNVTVTVVNVVNTAGDTTKDTTPPSISNVTVSDITPFGATVKFGTSEDAVSFVEFGKDVSYGDSAGDKTFGATHAVKLHGLTLGTDYHIKVSAVDKAGNTGTSADQTFKTTFLSENLKDMANVENIEQFQKEIESAIESILPSLVPPFVTKPIISDITESGATISFKTNIKAFPVVVFAEDGAYDETKDNPYTGEVSDTVTKDTTHTLALTGLKGNTKYHVQARGFSLPKVIGKSGDVTFITKASKIAGSIVERKKDSFTVVWTTDEPTTSIVEFKDLKRGITERKVDEAKKTSHSMKVENLPSGTAYEVNLSGMTEQGNIAEAGSPLSVTTSTDTTPPGISGFKVDNALVPGRTDRIQTIVSWVTDEPSNSTVYYEEGAGTAGDTTELANKNEVLDSFVTGHSVILPSLKPGTIYRLKVTSADDSGNLGSFGPRTVITPQQTASITDIIFKNFEDSFKFLRKI